MNRSTCGTADTVRRPLSAVAAGDRVADRERAKALELGRWNARYLVLGQRCVKTRGRKLADFVPGAGLTHEVLDASRARSRERRDITDAALGPPLRAD